MIEAYTCANKMFVDYNEPPLERAYSSYLNLDLEEVEHCVSGPKRPYCRGTPNVISTYMKFWVRQIIYLLCLAGTFPCLVLIPSLFFIPVSPRWLEKMGFTEDFEVSLQVLRGFDTDISLEVNEIKIGIGLLVLQQLTGINGVLFYSATIFDSAERVGISSSNVATFGLGAVQVVATAVSTWLVDKTGRRILLIISSSGMTVSLFVVAVSFFIKDIHDGLEFSDDGGYTLGSFL